MIDILITLKNPHHQYKALKMVSTPGQGAQSDPWISIVTLTSSILFDTHPEYFSFSTFPLPPPKNGLSLIFDPTVDLIRNSLRTLYENQSETPNPFCGLIEQFREDPFLFSEYSLYLLIRHSINKLKRLASEAIIAHNEQISPPTDWPSFAALVKPFERPNETSFGTFQYQQSIADHADTFFHSWIMSDPEPANDCVIVSDVEAILLSLQTQLAQTVESNRILFEGLHTALVTHRPVMEKYGYVKLRDTVEQARSITERNSLKSSQRALDVDSPLPLPPPLTPALLDVLKLLSTTPVTEPRQNILMPSDVELIAIERPFWNFDEERYWMNLGLQAMNSEGCVFVRHLKKKETTTPDSDLDESESDLEVRTVRAPKYFLPHYKYKLADASTTVGTLKQSNELKLHFSKDLLSLRPSALPKLTAPSDPSNVQTVHRPALAHFHAANLQEYRLYVEYLSFIKPAEPIAEIPLPIDRCWFTNKYTFPAFTGIDNTTTSILSPLKESLVTTSRHEWLEWKAIASKNIAISASLSRCTTPGHVSKYRSQIARKCTTKKSHLAKPKAAPRQFTSTSLRQAVTSSATVQKDEEYKRIIAYYHQHKQAPQIITTYQVAQPKQTPKSKKAAKLKTAKASPKNASQQRSSQNQIGRAQTLYDPFQDSPNYSSLPQQQSYGHSSFGAQGSSLFTQFQSKFNQARPVFKTFDDIERETDEIRVISSLADSDDTFQSSTPNQFAYPLAFRSAEEDKEEPRFFATTFRPTSISALGLSEKPKRKASSTEVVQKKATKNQTRVLITAGITPKLFQNRLSLVEARNVKVTILQILANKETPKQKYFKHRLTIFGKQRTIPIKPRAAESQSRASSLSAAVLQPTLHSTALIEKDALSPPNVTLSPQFEPTPLPPTQQLTPSPQPLSSQQTPTPSPLPSLLVSSSEIAISPSPPIQSPHAPPKEPIVEEIVFTKKEEPKGRSFLSKNRFLTKTSGSSLGKKLIARQEEEEKAKREEMERKLREEREKQEEERIRREEEERKRREEEERQRLEDAQKKKELARTMEERERQAMGNEEQEQRSLIALRMTQQKEARDNDVNPIIKVKRDPDEDLQDMGDQNDGESRLEDSVPGTTSELALVTTTSPVQKTPRNLAKIRTQLQPSLRYKNIRTIKQSSSSIVSPASFSSSVSRIRKPTSSLQLRQPLMPLSMQHPLKQSLDLSSSPQTNTPSTKQKLTYWESLLRLTNLPSDALPTTNYRTPIIYTDITHNGLGITFDEMFSVQWDVMRANLDILRERDHKLLSIFDDDSYLSSLHS
ncbi:hypothetical protein BLNAU_23765 [Blattamonas nauphoetae]|uniref:Uncharacterized protein n=1 Tax=Blattamonas nauphoetae TaxID=2049346 RepID=A0ABQ9WTG0_9EUKA|nr:hypothetical protein BLNAU_23765 [Blattamonas nauphoetae]